MLSDTLVLTDGTTPLSFTLTSRSGMTSQRRIVGSSAAEAMVLEIKNDIDLTSATKLSAHVAKISGNYVEPTTGELCPYQVYTVIRRNRKVPDALLEEQVKRLADLMDNTDTMGQILIGGN